MIQQYFRSQLEGFSISQLRDVCQQASIPTRRSKADCIDDILAAQPQLAQAELEVYVDEQVNKIAPQTCATCAYFQSHEDETDKGWCGVFNTFAREHHRQTQDCINNFNEEQTDDYLFHDDPLPTPHSPLPAVPDTFVLADYLLRRSQVGGEYAIRWDVYKSTTLIDSAFMRWDGFWQSTNLGGRFKSIQEVMAEIANPIRVVEKHRDEGFDKYVVVNADNGNHYTVTPEHPESKERCECGDAHYRGRECKHQKAVKSYRGSGRIEAMSCG